jgi:hypothetical protein
MIRKQVYIEPRQEKMLKRRANQLGLTQAKIIREALDRIEHPAANRRRETDPAAAHRALTFMRSLASPPSTGRRTWARESLYEDRVGRWNKSWSTPTSWSMPITEDFTSGGRLEGMHFLNPLIPSFELARWV